MICQLIFMHSWKFLVVKVLIRQGLVMSKYDIFNVWFIGKLRYKNYDEQTFIKQFSLIDENCCNASIVSKSI